MKYPKNYHKVISYLDSVFKPLYTKSQLGYLFDLEYYKDLDILNISKIIIEKSTISGKDKTEVKNKNDIIKIYNEWKGVIIGNSTNKMCDDNTIIYRFIMNNKKEYIIEKECDFLVIDGMRYNYKVEKLEKS